MSTVDAVDGRGAPGGRAAPLARGVAAGLRRLSPFRERRTRGEWIADWCQFVAALGGWLVYGFVMTDYFVAIPDWFWPLDRVMGLVACVALWWARYRPVGTALVVLVPGIAAVSAGIAVVVALYRLGAHARPRDAVVVTAVVTVTAVPYHAVLPLPDLNWGLYVASLVLTHLLWLSLGLLTRSRRRVLEGLRAEAVQERELSEARVAGARRDERERMAREMHDVLAHRVSLISVHAGALEYRLEGGSVPSSGEVHDAVGVIRENARLAVEELRQVLDVLRSDGGAGDTDPVAGNRPQPRVADLPGLVEEARAAGQRVTSRIDLPGLAGLPGTVQRTVYRVVQEGLTNARKHAPGAQVVLEAAPDGDAGAVRVTVANALPVGVTAHETSGAGAGLAGLAERVRLDGGTVTSGVHDGEFRLAVVLPGERP